MLRRAFEIRWTALASLVVFLAPACGGSQPPPQPPQSEAKSETASTPAAAVSPKPAAATDESWEGEDEATGKKNLEATSASSGSSETRTTEVIAKVIKDNRKPFRQCYEKAREKQPDLEGTLTLHFVLDPRGKVKLAELNGARSTIQSAAAVDCAIDALKQLTFPPSSRGMESNVNYPFDFKR